MQAARDRVRGIILNALLPALALAAFWLLLLQPLVQPGKMTCSHDGALYLLRVSQLDAMVRQGIVWPRWLPGMAYGYGYPLFNFHPALGLYAAVILHHLGLTLLQSWNLTLALSVLASGLTMYLWTRQVLGARGGFVAAIAYMFAPYVLYDVYWRGNITESLTLPLSPWVMWALLRTILERRWRYALVGALAYAAVLLTHPAVSLMLTPIVLVYVLFLFGGTRDRGALAFQLAATFTLALGLAAFFLIPAYWEKEQVQLWRAITPGGQNFRNHFVSLGELFGPAAASDPLLINPSPPRGLGWASGVWGLVGVLITLWARPRLNRIHKHHVAWAALTLGGVVLMMLPVAEPIWSHAPLLPFIQYPWRFLGIASLLLAFLAGAGVAALEQWRGAQNILALLGAVMLVVNATPWMYPRLCPASDEATQAGYTKFERSTGLIGTTSSAEYLPVAVQEVPTNSPMVRALRTDQPVVRWDAPGARVVQARDNGLDAELVLESEKPVQVVYRAFYFPGWRATLDGEPIPLSIVPPLGLMAVNVPAGRHTLAVQFGNTPIRTIGEIVSLGAIVLVIAIGLYELRARLPVSRSMILSLSPAAWLGAIGVGLTLLVLKLGVVDRMDTPLRWRRLQGDQFKGAAYTSTAMVAGRARLLGYDVRPQPAVAGDLVYADLYWTLEQPLDFRVAVRLVDERGLEWSDKIELDVARGSYSVPPPPLEWPAGAYADDRHAVRILPGTPPGDYWLVALPFDPATLAPLPISAGPRAPGDYPGVSVGRLRVILPGSPSAIELQDWSVRVQSRLGDDLVLMGYSQDREEAASGQEMLLSFGWQAQRPPQSDYTVQLELVTANGQVVAQWSALPGREHFPTTRWQAGQFIRSQILVRVPGRVESGEYRWRLTLLDGNGAQVGQVMLGRLGIVAPQRLWTAPAVARPLNIQLGDAIVLAGLDAPGNIESGQPLSVTLVWQATGQTDHDYKVFVHLLSADGQVVAQSDAVPAGWTRPTSSWQIGEYVVDLHTLDLKGDLAEGKYLLVAGMYDSTSGQRLAVRGGGDTIHLGEILLSSHK